MKVQDQMTGLQAICGHPLIHIALFMGILFLDLDVDMTCETNGAARSYKPPIILLTISHGVNAIRLPVEVICTQLRILFVGQVFKIDLVERFANFLGVVTYLWAILNAMDTYFFTIFDSKCEPWMIAEMRGWLFLEMAFFVTTFLAFFVFILTSNLTIRESGIQFQQQKAHRIDFLLKYRTMSGLFVTFV